jgi:hypothetical protein
MEKRDRCLACKVTVHSLRKKAITGGSANSSDSVPVHRLLNLSLCYRFAATTATTHRDFTPHQECHRRHFPQNQKLRLKVYRPRFGRKFATHNLRTQTEGPSSLTLSVSLISDSLAGYFIGTPETHSSNVTSLRPSSA